MTKKVFFSCRAGVCTMYGMISKPKNSKISVQQKSVALSLLRRLSSDFKLHWSNWLNNWS